MTGRPDVRFASSIERDRHLAAHHRHLCNTQQVGLGPEASRLYAVRFADRHDAGRRLSRRLDLIDVPDPLVIAIPRGGVPVAYEVATTLRPRWMSSC